MLSKHLQPKLIRDFSYNAEELFAESFAHYCLDKHLPKRVRKFLLTCLFDQVPDVVCAVTETISESYDGNLTPTLVGIPVTMPAQDAAQAQANLRVSVMRAVNGGYLNSLLL